jgi:hypothetical protein
MGLADARYFVSLCEVTLRQNRQYFLSSSLLGVLIRLREL